MKDTFQQLGLLVAVIALSFLAGYIVMDISRVYKIPYLQDLSWLQIYGLFTVVILAKGTRKSKGDYNFEDQTAQFSYSLFTLLFTWGFARLLYFILS